MAQCCILQVMRDGAKALNFSKTDSPMISRRRCWLSISMLLLLGAAIATASEWEPLRRTLADLSRVTEAPGMLCVLVAPPLFLLILFLWAGWEVNSGSGARWSGELDNLVQRHRQGLLKTGGTADTQEHRYMPAIIAGPAVQTSNCFRLQLPRRRRIWIAWCRKSAAEHGHQRPALLHRPGKTTVKSDPTHSMLSAGLS